MSTDRNLDRSSGNGFAIASLIIGIVATLLSVFLIGSVFGVVGGFLGVVHLCQRKRSNGMAWAGLGFSVMGIVLSGMFLVVYLKAVNTAFTALLKDIDLHQQQQNSQTASTASIDDWQGVAAPELKLTTIDGKSITLSELKGKRVILDFWATWCAPCREEIPHFIKLQDEHPDDLVIIGISDEEEVDIKAFAEEHKINYLMVATSDLPAPFDQIGSYPTTFFIDRQGVIQEIVVGYHGFDDLKTHATAADYTGEVKAPPAAPTSSLLDALEQVTLTPAWTIDDINGQSLSVADWNADGTDELLIVGGDNKLRIVSLEGKVLETVDLPEDSNFAKLGRHPQGPRLLAYASWGKAVTILDRQGATVWTYPSPKGVNGADWGDLDGDGTDELIIGMNGDGGLHAVSANGTKRWQFTSIGNVWNQAVISATANSPARIFATEAGGTVQVFDSKGQHLKTLEPLGKYFSSMSAHRNPQDGSLQIIVSDEVTAALDEQGTVRWSTAANESRSNWRTPMFASGDINNDGSLDWAFVDITGELVIVNAAGQKLATLPDQRSSHAHAIAQAAPGKSLLILLSGVRLQAYTPVADSSRENQ